MVRADSPLCQHGVLSCKIEAVFLYCTQWFDEQFLVFLSSSLSLKVPPNTELKLSKNISSPPSIAAPVKQLNTSFRKRNLLFLVQQLAKLPPGWIHQPKTHKKYLEVYNLFRVCAFFFKMNTCTVISVDIHIRQIRVSEVASLDAL